MSRHTDENLSNHRHYLNAAHHHHHHDRMESKVLQALAYPGVVSLVAFLALSSQFLFASIEPGALRKGEIWIFNVLVVALLICYTRTCFTNPGYIPKDWHELVLKSDGQMFRYCRRCDQPKPPRSHHCKTCNRCIPKMDHHCIWTGNHLLSANCVSHVTFPHFVRFLTYAVAAMAYLEYFLYERCAVLWVNRKLPSYLGPTVLQLSHLFVLVALNSTVLLALSILLGKTLWGLGGNVSTIEGWEIERHHNNIRRARPLGGFLTAPDGSRVRIEKQEYPWDIGIFSNICQGMGTWNPVSWIFPFTFSPSVQSGLVFEHNGIEDPSKPWPPPDPDRMFRAPRKQHDRDAFIQPMDVDSFKQRQAADMERSNNSELLVRRKPFAERYRPYEPQQQDDDDYAITDEEEDTKPDLADRHNDEGEEAWATREGERLADFGVDEDIEFYDEDDIPLAELIRRRKTTE